MRCRSTWFLLFSTLRTRACCCAPLLLVGTVLGPAVTVSALACAATGKVSGPTREPAGQSAPAVGSAQLSFQSVQEIALERRCFGCANQYRLTFHRDGTGTRTTLTPPVAQTFRGTVSREEFDALAMLLQREGFFNLADLYRDPELQDGELARTTVVAEGLTKTVLNGNQAGPPNLKAIEDAIDALGKKIAWRL
jgi:hypothetical protein